MISVSVLGFIIMFFWDVMNLSCVIMLDFFIFRKWNFWYCEVVVVGRCFVLVVMSMNIILCGGFFSIFRNEF